MVRMLYNLYCRRGAAGYAGPSFPNGLFPAVLCGSGYGRADHTVSEYIIIYIIKGEENMKTGKKLWSVLLALVMCVSLMGGAFSVSAADSVTLTPTGTVGGESITLTATGLDENVTAFDMSAFGFGGINYGLWFDHDGTFSFDKDVTLSYQGTQTAEVKAGETVKIADGVNGGSWSEYAITLDDGNFLTILDKDAPGNFASLSADAALSDVGAVGAGEAAPAEEDSGDAEAPDASTGATEEAPAEETPAEETPAEETPAEEAPVEDETPPVVMRSNQTITVDGEAVEFDVYNIDGNNYFKLRDIAMTLDGTDSTFAVGYDSATRTITCTSGEAYEANGSELVIGEDLSATAVRSNQPLYVNGELSTIKAYNLGGNNYFQLRELGAAIGFGVDYDAATRTVIIDSTKAAAEEEAPAAGAYTLSAKAVSYIGTYEKADDNELEDYASGESSFVSGSLGYNNGYGFSCYFSDEAFPASFVQSSWPVINIGSDLNTDYIDVVLELDEGSDTNKHAVITVSPKYAGTEAKDVYLVFRAKSANPFYLYKITITPEE